MNWFSARARSLSERASDPSWPKLILADVGARLFQSK